MYKRLQIRYSFDENLCDQEICNEGDESTVEEQQLKGNHRYTHN